MTESSTRRGISTRSVETGTALLTFAFGAIVTYGSYALGSRWGDDGPQAGYFPFYVGLLVCIGSLVNLVIGLREGARQRDRVFVEWEALRRVMAVLVPAALFVAGVQLVGIYFSALVYIAGFMIWLGGYGWHRAFAVGFSVSLVLYMMFEVWFQVPLPKGAYDPLALIGL
jgi:putative tricarboxylic transport membrane protein